jgi:hypothetical protein
MLPWYCFQIFFKLLLTIPVTPMMIDVVLVAAVFGDSNINNFG